MHLLITDIPSNIFTSIISTITPQGLMWKLHLPMNTCTIPFLTLPFEIPVRVTCKLIYFRDSPHLRDRESLITMFSPTLVSRKSITVDRALTIYQLRSSRSTTSIRKKKSRQGDYRHSLHSWCRVPLVSVVKFVFVLSDQLLLYALGTINKLPCLMDNSMVRRLPSVSPLLLIFCQWTECKQIRS